MNLEEIEKKLRGYKREEIPLRNSAVLIPLLEGEDGIEILFEVRAKTLSVQPGEICFPGGKCEAGERPEETVIRETREELLVPERDIRLIGALSASNAPRGGLVYPFAGILKDYHDTFSKEEVDHVFRVPLSLLLEQKTEGYEASLTTVPGEDFPLDRIPGGKNYKWASRKRKIYFYRYRDYEIWGVTGYMLYQFLNILRS